MLQLTEEKIKCKSCSKLVEKDEYTDVCQICSKTTCKDCGKICDRCLATFCSKHSTENVVWRGWKKQKLILCDMCKEIWKP